MRSPADDGRVPESAAKLATGTSAPRLVRPHVLGRMKVAVDREKVRELTQWIDDATYKAGVLAMVVADKLAAGDIEGARAALPAYQEQNVIAEGLGDELVRLAGLGYTPDDEAQP